MHNYSTFLLLHHHDNISEYLIPLRVLWTCPCYLTEEISAEHLTMIIPVSEVVYSVSKEQKGLTETLKKSQRQICALEVREHHFCERTLRCNAGADNVHYFHITNRSPAVSAQQIQYNLFCLVPPVCFNFHHAWLWYQVYEQRWPSGDDWCNRHTKACRQTTWPPGGWNNRKRGLQVSCV